MFRSPKSHVSVLWGVLGVTFIAIGITTIIYEPLTKIAIDIINKVFYIYRYI